MDVLMPIIKQTDLKGTFHRLQMKGTRCQQQCVNWIKGWGDMQVYINNQEQPYMLSRNNVLTWSSFNCFRLFRRNGLLKQTIAGLREASQQPLGGCDMSVETAVSELAGEADWPDTCPGLPRAKPYFTIMWQLLPGSRTTQNPQPVANFVDFAHHYRCFLELTTLLLKEIHLLRIPCRANDPRKPLISNCLRLFQAMRPLLDTINLKSNLIEETLLDCDRLLKDSTPSASQDRPNQSWIKLRFGAFGVVLARMARTMRLLEDLQERTQQELPRLELLHARRQLAGLIRISVQDKRKNLMEICYSCESKVPSCDMEKHMKACRMFFELRKTIQKIDAEISGRHDDLKTMATEAKRLEMERKKEMERARGKGKKERGYIKEHAKSNLEQRMMREYSGRDSSYSDSSNSLDRLIPPKAPKSLQQCNSQDLRNYQWVADQLRLVASKILTHRQSVNLNIYNQLKNLRNTVKPKYDNIGITKRQISHIFELFHERMVAMQKLRKVQKEGNLTGVAQMDSFDFDLQQKKKRWYGREYNGEGYFSGEEASMRNFETNQGNNTVQLNSFRKIGLIGKGKYGQVYLVKKKKTGMKYAMKKVSIENAKNYSEVDIFQVINSPFLVKAAFSFTQGDYHYFVMQYMPHGNFSQLVQQRLFQHQAKQYLAQIVMAIAHLHQHGIIHRDIKPQNIVIDSKGHLKLTDYGLSEAGLIKQKQLEEQERSMSKFVLHIKGKCLRREEERERIVGSPYYMAPEVLRGEKATEMSDWWSFGVLVYLALTGSVPFKGNVEKDLEEITKKVLQRNIWPSYLKFGKGNDCISHQAKNLIDSLLCLDPQKRLGSDVQDIKSHNFFDGIDWDNLLQSKPFFAPDDGETTVDQNQGDDECEQDRFSSKSTNMSIRRDILNSETQSRYEKSQAPYRRLLAFAAKLES